MERWTSTESGSYPFRFLCIYFQPPPFPFWDPKAFALTQSRATRTSSLSKQDPKLEFSKRLMIESQVDFLTSLVWFWFCLAHHLILEVLRHTAFIYVLSGAWLSSGSPCWGGGVVVVMVGVVDPEPGGSRVVGSSLSAQP